MTSHALATRARNAPRPAAAGESDNVKVRQIVSAARKVFMKEGYGAASMDAIARGAGVSKATLYAHFEGKDALFAALIVAECKHLSEQVGRGALHRPDIRGTLLALAQDFNNLLCSGDGLTMFRIVVAEAPRFPELGRIFYNSGPNIMIDRIVEILRVAGDRGLLTLRDPRTAAIQFISLIKGELHFTRVLGLDQGRRNNDAYIEASVDLFLAGYGRDEKKSARSGRAVASPDRPRAARSAAKPASRRVAADKTTRRP